MQNNKIIKNFIREGNNELLLGCSDSIVRLTKDEAHIIVDYKDNDMKEFCFAAELNTEDVKEAIIIKMIMAFLQA